MWQSASNGEEVTIQLPHIQLAARVWGEAENPLLIALHGWLDNADSFLPLSGYLSEYRILAIDWPGHGFSEHRPGHYPLHWMDYLYDLDLLISHIKDSQPPGQSDEITVIGHSLGGIVASAYCAAFPSRIDHLILIEALIPLYEAPEKGQSRIQKSFQAHKHYLNNLSKPNRCYQNIEVAVNARHQLTRLDKQWCELLVNRNMLQHVSGVSWRSDPRLKIDSPLRSTQAQVEALMQNHATNTLFIIGSHGMAQLKEVLPFACRCFKKLQISQITGDHHLHMGSAIEVAAVIDQFIQNNTAD